MIGVVLGLITYFFTSTGFFGGDILKSLSVVETWYWVCFWLWAAVCTLIGLVSAGAIASEFKDKLVNQFVGILTGGAFGVFIAAILMFRIIIQLVLVNGLIDSIDPVSDDLTTKQIFGLVLLLIVSLVHRRSSEA